MTGARRLEAPLLARPSVGARMKVAKLDKARLATVQALEKKLGCCLVALEPEFCMARLSAAQLTRLKAVEKELGVVLLAYQAK